MGKWDNVRRTAHSFPTLNINNYHGSNTIFVTDLTNEVSRLLEDVLEELRDYYYEQSHENHVANSKR